MLRDDVDWVLLGLALIGGGGALALALAGWWLK